MKEYESALVRELRERFPAPEVNWKVIIVQLNAVGISLGDIAWFLGFSRHNPVATIRDGETKPSYAHGVQLLAMHAHYCKPKAEVVQFEPVAACGAISGKATQLFNTDGPGPYDLNHVARRRGAVGIG